MSKKKVVIVAPVHIYDDIRVFKKEACSIVNAGYQVVQFSRTHSGKELVDSGIIVKPVIYRNRIERFLNLITLFFRVWQEKADLYHLHNPDTIPLAILLKIIGKKVIYDTHENFYKKILLRQWIPKFLRFPAAVVVLILEKIANIICDAMIITQEEQKKNYKNAIVVGNAPVYVDYERVMPLHNNIELAYLGGISEDRGLNFMLELVDKLNQHVPTKLLLIGNSINDNALSLAMKTDIWQYVDYRGVLSQQEAFKLVQKSDFGLITLLDIADYKFTSPNKIYEYMMLGTPFIATDFPLWIKQLDYVNAGVFTTVEEVNDGLVEEIIAIKLNNDRYNLMCKSGKEYIQDVFNWNLVEEPTLIAIYKGLLK